MRFPGRPRTIRAKLALWYCGATTLVLAVYALGVLSFFQQSLAAELHHQLEDHLRFAESMLVRTPAGRIDWRPRDAGRGLVGDCAVTVFGADGQVLFRSPRPAGVAETALTTLSDDAVIGGLPVRIEVAKPAEQIRRRLSQLLFVLALGLPVALVVTGLSGYVLARRALAPVGAMAARARTISADRLGERFAVENPHDELGRLASVFNDTFAQLERSFAELGRFTADASHELRTPLTAMRNVGEVGLRQAKTAVDYQDVIGSMLEEARHLGQLIEDLLLLSRGEAGAIRSRLEAVDLRRLVTDVAALLEALAEEKEQSLRVDASDEVTVLADPSLLRRALVNLVDNAIKYSPQRGQIRVSVARRGDDAIVDIADSGPGIAPQHRELVFERFYRVDLARSRHDGGSGLGLSIARWAVEACGGRLQLATAGCPGATFRMLLRTLP